MTHPPVVIVDKEDQVVGEEMLDEARLRGLIYRLVFIVAVGSDGRVLLQKRSSKMRLWPGCWDISAGGHVDDGHTYEEAARFELEEELGVRGVPLREIAHFYMDTPLWGNVPAKRFCKLYQTSLDALPEGLGEEEVAAVHWFTKDELRALVSSQPTQIAEGLAYSLLYILEI
ncbi:MAG TPA: NUDIX domain-containing protein [Patescibacteria group bacterium]|nr:NUDIX domain-containing protein [Patescibacteria group bacterium]